MALIKLYVPTTCPKCGAVNVFYSMPRGRVVLINAASNSQHVCPPKGTR